MENKIRQLTDKLYEEGLQKGKTEAERLISDAKTEAQKIIDDAQQKSAEIIDQAKKRDEEMAHTALKDVKMAAQRLISDSMQSVKGMLSEVAISDELKKSFADNEFVSKLVFTIVENWSKQNPNAVISIAVPEASKPELDKYIASKTFENLKTELNIKVDNRIVDGFKIASSESGFYINFSDEQFNNFFNGYIREKVSEIVFGKK